MPRTLRPLFLAKGVYRRRRLRDAARLLPIFGLFLLMLPLLWGEADGKGADRIVVYVLAAWALLIALAAYLAPSLARSETDDQPMVLPDPSHEAK